MKVIYFPIYLAIICAVCCDDDCADKPVWKEGIDCFENANSESGALLCMFDIQGVLSPKGEIDADKWTQYILPHVPENSHFIINESIEAVRVCLQAEPSDATPAQVKKDLLKCRKFMRAANDVMHYICLKDD